MKKNTVLLLLMGIAFNVSVLNAFAQDSEIAIDSEEAQTGVYDTDSHQPKASEETKKYYSTKKIKKVVCFDRSDEKLKQILVNIGDSRDSKDYDELEKETCNKSGYISVSEYFELERSKRNYEILLVPEQKTINPYETNKNKKIMSEKDFEVIKKNISRIRNQYNAEYNRDRQE